MRELPRLCLVIKHPKGYIVKKDVSGLTMLKLSYEPYSDDIESIIYQFLFKAIGANKIICTDLGISHFKDERIRMIAVKIEDIKPVLTNCSVCALPDDLRLLNFSEMELVFLDTEIMEDYVAWHKYSETMKTLENKLYKLK